jgi:LytS/YehU family sensor histidine kinase
MVLRLVEETVVAQAVWFNPRIVAVCEAGLIGGPLVSRWSRTRSNTGSIPCHGLGCSDSRSVSTGQWLEMSVSDDGQGVSSTEVEQLFFAERPRVHALALLGRRLQGLFGDSFQLEVRSGIGEGTTVTMRIPLGKPFGFDLEAPISQGPKDLPIARQTPLQFTIHKTQKRER